MGRGIQNLKLYGLSLVATFLLMTVLGVWTTFGLSGPTDALGSIFEFLFEYPRISASIVIVLGFIVVADRIAG